MVGNFGKVYAVDLDASLLGNMHMRENVWKRQTSNIEIIVPVTDNPYLPLEQLDPGAGV